MGDTSEGSFLGAPREMEKESLVHSYKVTSKQLDEHCHQTSWHKPQAVVSEHVLCVETKLEVCLYEVRAASMESEKNQ